MQLSTSPSLEGLTEDDLLSLSREAEKRLRPFACGVGDCQRRYKNMNGLRYHYQHSGDHGAEGLRLLASGQHECLQQQHQHTGSGAAAVPGCSRSISGGPARVPPPSVAASVNISAPTTPVHAVTHGEQQQQATVNGAAAYPSHV